MSTAFLSHVVESRSLIPTRLSLSIVILYLLMLVFPFLHPLFFPDEPGAYPGFICYNFLLASMTAGTGREVLTCPFGYTVPAHSITIRRQLLTIGIICNVLFIAPMLLYPAATPADKLAALISVYFAGLAIFISVCVLVFTLKQQDLLPMLAVVAALFQMRPDLPQVITLTQAITGQPWLSVLGCLVMLHFFWRMFSRRELFRQLPFSPFISFIEGTNVHSHRQYKARLLIEQAKGSSSSEPQWYRTLASRLQQNHAHPLFCFGYQGMQMLHKMQLRARTPRLTSLIVLAVIVVAIAVLQTSYNRGGASSMLLAMLFGYAALALPPISSQPFLPYRRRDMAIADFLVGVLLNLMWVAGAFALMVLIDVTDGMEGSYWRADIGTLLGYHSLFVPWYLALRLWAARSAQGVTTLCYFLVPLTHVFAIRLLLPGYAAQSAGTAILLQVAVWLAYIPFVYLHYCKRDLVANTPRWITY